MDNICKELNIVLWNPASLLSCVELIEKSGARDVSFFGCHHRADGN